MAILPILTAPDPRLKTVSSPVDTVDDKLRQLMDDMCDTMYDAPGIGLAAIQVGVAKRVLVIDLQEEEGVRNPQFFVNPQIIWTSSEDISVYNEGCLSVPEQYAEVERPAECIVQYLDYHGKPQELSAHGLMATCLQHEMDHLDGILFVDHLSSIKRNMMIRKVKKLVKARTAE
ncbi:MAG: peptide deformylase [Kordiimonas sp.]|nr:peptide deformylase [Kordiimonas sp.]|tara:strand:- start:302 stop:823 length:522 start_codon:yes stop_codon:yes gene_type:complete